MRLQKSTRYTPDALTHTFQPAFSSYVIGHLTTHYRRYCSFLTWPNRLSVKLRCPSTIAAVIIKLFAMANKALEDKHDGDDNRSGLSPSSKILRFPCGGRGGELHSEKETERGREKEKAQKAERETRERERERAAISFPRKLLCTHYPGHCSALIPRAGARVLHIRAAINPAARRVAPMCIPRYPATPEGFLRELTRR